MRFATILILVGILFAIPSGTAVGPAENETIGNYSLKLYSGGNMQPAGDWETSLYTKTIELLKTSNFNSRTPRGGWKWDNKNFLQWYRETVSGSYLLVSFEVPITTETVGGNITVREIVLGLGGEYAGPLFTIDNEERIVAHSKYSGPLCIEILEMTKSALDER